MQARAVAPPAKADLPTLTPELVSQTWDAIVVGSGVGGLTAGTQMAAKGAKVLVLEKYIIPGGSAGARRLMPRTAVHMLAEQECANIRADRLTQRTALY